MKKKRRDGEDFAQMKNGWFVISCTKFITKGNGVETGSDKRVETNNKHLNEYPNRNENLKGVERKREEKLYTVIVYIHLWI